MALCGDYSAGMLSEVISFQRQGAATNTNGNVVPGAWAAIAGAPTRAYVKAASGFERAQASRTNAEVMLKVTVRYWSGLRESDSVVIRGRRHNIRFIDNIEFKDKWLTLSVDGGVAV
jgi:SPP1 family predicted phage head-tail adaptor